MSSVGTSTGLERELRDICGAEYVDERNFDVTRIDYRGTPPAAVWPGSPDEVAAVLRVANERVVKVRPVGALVSNPTLDMPSEIWALLFNDSNPSPAVPEADRKGHTNQPDLLLSTSRLNEVEHYDPGDLTIGIGAGCTVAHLLSKVAADGLLFAADSPQPERATIGGILASGITGPLRHGYGGLRDYCIGIRFVTGDGRKAKGGGRVVKNVAGYDLMKLLIGSHGTLAIITSASFKLFPAPRQTRTFVAEFHTSGEALKFRDSVLRSPLSPMCLELVSPKALVGLRPDAESNAWLICVRASGSDAVLRRYRAELGAAVTQELDGETETRWWQGIANFPIGESGCHEMARKVPELEDSETLAISVPLQAVAPVIELLERSEVPGVSMVGRVGVGHLLASFWLEGVESFVPALQKAVERFIQQLPAGSSIMTSRHRWWKTPTDLDSMRAIKHALDPKDILNQGRFAF